jgi:hypothetical protein
MLTLWALALADTYPGAEFATYPGDGGMAVVFPGGVVRVVEGEDWDGYAERGWVAVDDDRGRVSVTESGRYWAGRFARSRNNRKGVGA